MAEEQKNIEVPKDTKVEETAPIVAEPAKEETPALAAVEAPAPAVEATEDKPAETVEEPKAEEVKEEVKPIEEGSLSHKAQGLSFPKNLIPTKEFFFFGTDAFEPKALSVYQRNEKSTETAQSNIAWASETGKGLLFIGDKKSPTGLINLSDASEPVVEGTHKFTLTSKGNKHSFKAASTAERDNWVAQLKLKIAEAKELATTVVETETYKKTVDSFKPAVPAKDEKPAEVLKEEPKPEEAKPEEALAAEPAKEEAKAEEKAESPKPLKSKRASFFNFIKKEEPKEKKEEVKPEETKAEETKPEEAPIVAAEADKPVEEAPKPVEETPAAPAPVPEPIAVATEAPATEDKPVEEAKPAESPKEKSKRNSFFGSVFSKKEKKAVEAKPTETTETPKEEEPAPVAETAPVIPPVESTTPLAAETNTPATVPTETTETTTNGEVKKDPKEKRKSSLPFLGKREKSPSPSEGESKSPFSKLRATIKSKTSPKSEEKPAEEAAKEETAETKPEEAPAAEPVKEEAPKAAVAQPEAETKPENVATSTPVVTAAA